MASLLILSVAFVLRDLAFFDAICCRSSSSSDDDDDEFDDGDIMFF
jgi:hypothetical protein